VLTNAIASIWTKRSLLFALVAGMIVAFVVFALQSGRIPIIRAKMTGHAYQSVVSCNPFVTFVTMPGL